MSLQSVVVTLLKSIILTAHEEVRGLLARLARSCRSLSLATITPTVDNNMMMIPEKYILVKKKKGRRRREEKEEKIKVRHLRQDFCQLIKDVFHLHFKFIKRPKLDTCQCPYLLFEERTEFA